MKVLIIFLLALFLCGISCHSSDMQKDESDVTVKDARQDNPYRISEQDIKWMREATIQQLKGCRVKGAGGVWIHTPDGVGNYKALWTRDSYYMVEYAGDLMDPKEIKASIYYLINGQREDGCIPDRVNIEGKPVYSPGGPNKPMADHALDNGPFMAMMVCSYVNQFNDNKLFVELEPKLLKGLDHIFRSESGLVYNNPKKPECVYGFTDIVKKTGNLLFSSLIYYKACIEMENLCKKNKCGNPEEYRKQYESIRKAISKLWDEKSGMFWAADIDCKQIDIWGSAYAIDIGITSEKQTEKITDYFFNSYDQIIMRGQVRHLPGSDSCWQQLFHPCKEGTYQNGAFWATPLSWVLPVYQKRDPMFAQKMLQTVIDDFKENGINECINKDYVKIPNFVVSATNVYALTH